MGYSDDTDGKLEEKNQLLLEGVTEKTHRTKCFVVVKIKLITVTIY